MQGSVACNLRNDSQLAIAATHTPCLLLKCLAFNTASIARSTEGLTEGTTV